MRTARRTIRFLVLGLSGLMLALGRWEPSLAIQAAAGSWRSSSNGMWGGPIEVIAISPTFNADRTLWVGANARWWAFLFRSMDGGDNWTEVGEWDFSGNFHLKDLVVAPDGSLFAATSCLAFSCGGVHYSGDRGSTWTTRGLTNTKVYGLAVSPNFAADQMIFAATESGIYRSTDGGLSWSRVHSQTTNKIKISPGFSSDHTLFASGDALLRSNDGGLTWTKVLTGYVGAFALSPSFASDRKLFAAVWRHPNTELYYSSDAGETWNLIWERPGDTIIDLALSPNFASDHTLFAVSWNGVYRSTDGGNTWTRVGEKGRALAISPGFATDQTLFVGTDYGVYRSTDGGNTWQPLSSLRRRKIRIMSLEPSPTFATDRTVFAGTLGEWVYRSINGGELWNQRICPICLYPVIFSVAYSPNFASDRTVFLGSDGAGIYRSTDGGNSWQLKNEGLSYFAHWVPSMAVSPDFQNDGTVFAGTWDGIYRSTNRGENWTRVAFPSKEIYVIRISPSFSADRTLFAGLDDGVYRSTDGGNNWTGLGLTKTLDLVLSPAFASDRTLFAATTEGVYRSTNGGTTWERKMITPTTSLAISGQFASDRIIFAGTDEGVYQSTDGGETWQPINDGLDDLRIWDLAYLNGVPPALLAATSTGVWRYDLRTGYWVYLPLVLRNR